MQVIPIAGHDGMLLNLSGAHSPFFTRNLLVLTDDAGHTGVGEVPGGERIRQTLEDARPLVEGQSIGHWNPILNQLRSRFAERDSAGRGVAIQIDVEAVLQQINDAGIEQPAGRIDGFPLLACARIPLDDGREPPPIDEKIFLYRPVGGH
jgi:hypothetical protein